jgi:hypothetical protein
MPKQFLFASLFILAGIGLTVAGCAKQEASQQPSTPPEASQAQPAAPHEGHQQGEAGMTGHDMAGMTEQAASAMHNQYEEVLAQLSPEDRALAEKQKVCPVSGQPLGAMGKPYKVTVEGRDVLLCCQGCEAKIKADPDEYLVKLPQ